MTFDEEMGMIDMEIDYELNWAENARIELVKLHEELLLKQAISSR